MKSIVIFCGSSVGNQPIYSDMAKELGKLLARKDIKIVYGGGQAGLMGLVADSALAEGGEVIGVIPEFLNTKERKHQHLTQQIEVKTMHQRKTILYELCDAAIALPGGFGTLDELFEIITWNQLTLHSKTVGLLNVNGFYDHLYQHIQFACKEGFAQQAQTDNLHIADNVNGLLKSMLEADLID
ncbi:TIGR00730 family Rossman fold protein [Chitinophaga caeni]|uniref:Cytokinin riboside 5'-monophosphate phosphoribohydrolase n=1 Tax=Chitinophaga caeni TaxID=2029983 RepID=A0A291R0N2_9BACT|nr:TIGR00730 family Rossman fold protein [Chitinophaga caeni]